ncbi:hypothetical protein ACFPPD_20505 [Cohnella suwonensis]|uniref:Uncharacterized protein n=1 Tax=Cohnella suwonensis TaxID=696072 RepID=A0ABW0LZ45_9BACL
MFKSNSYYNFVAGQISENAANELKEKLSHSLTEAYSRGIFGEAGNKLAAGATKAEQGAVALKVGTQAARSAPTTR